MNRRLMTILLSAFIVAAVASYVVFRMVGDQISQNAKKQTVKIVVATRDLEAGALLKATDLGTGETVGAPGKDVVLKPETAIGRGVLAPIYAGEPLNEKRLAKVGSGAGLAAIIPAGMRACAVKVDDVVGVAGFASPGMRVDVLIAGKTTGENAGTKVKTLLQNIEVLSAGKNFQPDSEGRPAEATVVNLLVTPAQAEMISLASSNETRIQLVLRNPIDREIAVTPGAELAGLFGAAPKAPVVVARTAPVARPVPMPVVEKPAPPPVHRIEVMNGGKQTEQSFTLQGARR